MKNLLKEVLIICYFTFICVGCTTDEQITEDLQQPANSQFNNPCINELPKTRLINNGTVAFDFKVFDNQGAVLVDIPGIPVNTTTSWTNFAEGEVLFLVNSNDTNINDKKVLLQMDACMAYEIEIDSNNNIVSLVPITL